MTEEETLTRRLVAAYRPWVLSRLEELGVAVPLGLESALAEGEAWLEATLGELLERAFAEQGRGPLEVFQEAMRFPTAALEAANVDPVARDPADRSALPGDRFHLAPASSSALGEEAWQAHLAWGMAKAAALAPPLVGCLTRNLMDRARVEEAVKAAGLAMRPWGSLADLEEDVIGRRPVLALVDLEHPQADQGLRRLTEAGVRTAAFGPHVDDLGMARARALGAAEVLPRSRFFIRLPELLPTLA